MTWAAIIAFSGIGALAVLALHVASKANRRTRIATARADTAEHKIDALAEWSSLSLT